MNEQNQLAPASLSIPMGSPFSSIQAFEGGQRMAQALAASDIVPDAYKKNVANTIVALEIAQRTGNSIMSVMQSLHVIKGKPSWSSSYIIAAVNTCGRFETLRFKYTGEGMAKKCVAWTRDKQGNLIEGAPVSMEMAKAEGWLDKPGSKWKTMPDLMLQYRAAAFFGRVYAPDIMLGMQTEEEIHDVVELADGTKVLTPRERVNQSVRARRSAKAAPASDAEPVVETAPAAEPPVNQAAEYMRNNPPPSPGPAYAEASSTQPELPTVNAEVVEPAPVKRAAPKPKEVIL